MDPGASRVNVALRCFPFRMLQNDRQGKLTFNLLTNGSYSKYLLHLDRKITYTVN
jgi:hypothetical protein